MGVKASRTAKEFIHRSIETKGVVTQLIENKDKTFTPIASFKDSSGKAIAFSSSSASIPSRYNIGEEVMVMYDPLFPSKPRIKGFLYLWFFSILFGVLSTLFLIGAVILWVFRDAIFVMAGHPELAGPNKSKQTGSQKKRPFSNR